jgi:hypothetical protein
MGYAMVITASIAAGASLLNTALAFMLRRSVRPPSGGTLGEVAERTHHSSAVNTAGIKTLLANDAARKLEHEQEKEVAPDGRD